MEEERVGVGWEGGEVCEGGGRETGEEVGQRRKEVISEGVQWEVRGGTQSQVGEEGGLAESGESCRLGAACTDYYHHCTTWNIGTYM